MLGDEIIDSAVARLSKRSGVIEEKIVALLEKYIGSFDTRGGRLLSSDYSAGLIANIKKEIDEILKKTGYFKEVEGFFQDFSKIQTNMTKFYSKQGIDIKKLKLHDLQKWAVDNVKFNLQEQGLHKAFIRPVQESLSRSILLGSSLKDVQKELREKVPGTLQRHVIQVSRYSMGQYEGTINQKVFNEFDFNAISYVGSVIANTRPQCRRWIEKYNGIIPIEKLKKEIEWAYKNGTGMIPGTTVDNFLIYRAGFSCRHKAIPIRVSKDK